MDVCDNCIACGDFCLRSSFGEKVDPWAVGENRANRGLCTDERHLIYVVFLCIVLNLTVVMLSINIFLR